MTADRDPLHHLFKLSFIAEEMHKDLHGRMPYRYDARSMAGNQGMAEDAAKTLIKRTVAALMDLAELGASVDLPKTAAKDMEGVLSDAWEDAIATAWDRTRDHAEEREVA